MWARGLQRPECILAESDGTLWSADARGGSGEDLPGWPSEHHHPELRSSIYQCVRRRQPLHSGHPAQRAGLCRQRRHPHLQLRHRSSGGHGPPRATPALCTTASTESPSARSIFVLRDSKDRIYLTISTKIKNWMSAMSPNVCDGYIALADHKGLRGGGRGVPLHQ